MQLDLFILCSDCLGFSEFILISSHLLLAYVGCHGFLGFSESICSILHSYPSRYLIGWYLFCPKWSRTAGSAATFVRQNNKCFLRLPSDYNLSTAYPSVFDIPTGSVSAAFSVNNFIMHITGEADYGRGWNIIKVAADLWKRCILLMLNQYCLSNILTPRMMCSHSSCVTKKDWPETLTFEIIAFKTIAFMWTVFLMKVPV